MTEIVKALLVRARSLLAEPHSRLVSAGYLAEDSSGVKCDPLDASAVRYAPMGAVRRACFELGYPEQNIYQASFVLNRVVTARIGDQCLGYYNDHATHEQVLTLFDEATELVGVLE